MSGALRESGILKFDREEVSCKELIGYNTSPASIIRYLGRTGDFIYRPFDQTYWKIYCVAEDFAPVGWVQVLASQQIETPTEVVALIEQIINPPQPEPEPEPEEP